MKKSTIFTTISTFILFLAGVFALKANKNISIPPTIYYYDGIGYSLLAYGCNTTTIFATSGSATACYGETGGTLYPLFWFDTGSSTYRYVYTNTF